MKKIKSKIFKLLTCLLTISLIFGVFASFSQISALPNISTNLTTNSNESYIIESAYNGRYFHHTTSNNTLNVWSYSEKSFQRWYIQQNSDNTYSFRSRFNTAQYVEIYCANYTSGQPITLYDYTGNPNSPAARFYLRQNTDGSYCISPKSAPNLVLSVYSGDDTTYEHNERTFQLIENQTIVLSSYTGTSNQCWNIQFANQYSYHTELDSGVYYINSQYNNEYLSQYTETAVARVQQYSGKTHQRWNIINLGGGIYLFNPCNTSSRYLELYYGENKNGQPATLSDYSNNLDSPYIKMRLLKNSDGSFKICPIISPTRALGVYMGTNDSVVINGRPFYKSNATSVELQLRSTSTTQNWEFTRILPLSGSELDYDPELWSGDIQTITNCYAYAINNQVKDYEIGGINTPYLQQPGNYSGADDVLDNSLFNAPATEFIALVEADFAEYNENNGTSLVFRPIAADVACEPGNYKVALCIKPGYSYHWYRQDSDGFWSSKNGEGPVTKHMAPDPRYMDRGDFSEFIGFFEVTPWNRYIDSIQ